MDIILNTKVRKWKNKKQNNKTYYFNDEFVDKADAYETALRYKKEDKRIKYMIFPNQNGMFSLYLTRVIRLFG